MSTPRLSTWIPKGIARAGESFGDLGLMEGRPAPSEGWTRRLWVEERRRLWERVDALRETGGAIVFATQNVEELERHANRVVALRDGQVVFDGTLSDYVREPLADLFA